ncbi:hypothetical protein GGF31_006480 [Allomyces arbusculus]|nr:hypothetical protein GGF31_006480 [Allomyces arbusculus]
MALVIAGLIEPTACRPPPRLLSIARLRHPRGPVVALALLLVSLLLSCTPLLARAQAVQSATGWGNNPVKSWWGAAGRPLSRSVVPSGFADNISAVTWTAPSPRLIAKSLFDNAAIQAALTNNGAPTTWSALLSYFNELLYLDLVQLQLDPTAPFPIPVPACDATLDPACTGTVVIQQARAAGNFSGPINEFQAYNLATAFIDAGFLYGTSTSTQQSLRTLTGGLLNLPNNQLPTVTYSSPRTLGSTVVPAFQPVALAGDLRINKHPALVALVTILAREHNRKAVALAATNPTWTDEQLFQGARRWVISVWQRTIFDETYGATIGTGYPSFPGYSNTTNPEIDTFAAVCALRLGTMGRQPVLYRYNDDGSEFATGHIYTTGSFTPLPLVNFSAPGALEAVLRGLVGSAEARMGPGAHTSVAADLALMIHRARDLGVPSYVAVRRALALSVPTSMADISSNAGVQAVLTSLYGSVANVEGCVGAWAESFASTARVGPTIAAAIAKLLTTAYKSDTFYYASPTSGYSANAIAVKQATMASIFVANTNLTVFPNNVINPANPLVAFKNATAATSAATDLYAARTVQLEAGTTLNWTIAEPYITFQLATSNTGWMAIGVGGYGMPNTMDIALITWPTTANPVIDDYYNSGYSPLRDTANGGTADLTGFAYMVDAMGRNRYTWRRLLASGDARDLNITTGYMPLAFAYGPTPNLAYHGSRRGKTYVNFYATASTPTGTIGGGNGTTTPPPPTKYSKPIGLKVLHSLLMILAFFFVIPFSVFTARYWASKNWLDLHFKTSQFVFSQTALSLLSALVAQDGQLSSAHGIWGMVTSVGLGLTMLLGISASMMARFGRTAQTWSRRLHLPLAIGTWCVGVYDSLLGCDAIEKLNPAYKWFRGLTWACVVVVLVSLVVGEVWRVKYGRVAIKTLHKVQRLANFSLVASKSGLLKDEDEYRRLPEFTWAELNEKVASGRLWLVIDAVIYDVTAYIDTHPGGRDILLRYVGADASMAFNGIMRSASVTSTTTANTTMRPRHVSAMLQRLVGASPATSASGMGRSMSARRLVVHAHSRLARLKLNTLAIGVLAEDSDEKRRATAANAAVATNDEWVEGDLVPSWIPRPPVLGMAEEQFRPLRLVSKRRVWGPGGGGAEPGPSLLGGLTAAMSLTPVTPTQPAAKAHPVYLFRFAFPREIDEVWLKPGDAVQIQVAVPNTTRFVVRHFTPLVCHCVGHMDLLIRVYPDGALTSALDQVEIDDDVLMRGPIRCPKSLLKLAPVAVGRTFPGTDDHAGAAVGGWPTVVDGMEVDRDSRGCFETVGLVAAGTGITPMLLLIDYYARFCPRDPATNQPVAKITLLYQASTAADLIYAAELQELATSLAPMLRVEFFLSHATPATASSTLAAAIPTAVPTSGPIPAHTASRITRDALRKHLPPPATRTAGGTSTNGAPTSRPPSVFARTLGGGGSVSTVGGASVSVNGTLRRRPSVSFVLGGAPPVASVGPPQPAADLADDAVTPAGTLGRRGMPVAAVVPVVDADATTTDLGVGAQQDALIVVCGPPGFNTATVEMLQQLGYGGAANVVVL